MLTRATLALLAATSLSSPLAAQTVSATGETGKVWRQMSGYVLQAANDVPEATYGYRPTKDVRSFGEIIGHVAGSQNMFCAVALGEQPPAEDAVEKSATTKDALVKALKASNDYCARAYAQTDAEASGSAQFFGQTTTRMMLLVMNAAHDGEHYGNLVTYMRMNGMVPPSSRPQRTSGN